MRLSHISKTYHNKDKTHKLALDDVDLEFLTCGLVVILGSSGCGKTTLLRIIAGKDNDFEGEVVGKYNVDLIDQDFKLFESLTVFDNLLLATKDKDEIKRYLKALKLYDSKDKKVKKLSNGQKRRVQVLMALLQRKDVLLCDEPTSSLDGVLANAVMDMLKDYAKEHLVIVVTHDIALAHKYADRLIEIDDGKIISDKTLSENKPLIKHKKHKAPSFVDHVAFAFKYLRSRIFTYSFLTVFIALILLCTYCVCSLFMTIRSSTDEKIAFRKNTNLIVSEPYKERQNYDGYDKFVMYDRYTKKQIEDLLEYVPEIIAVSMYSDQDLYLERNYSTYDKAGHEIRGLTEEEYDQLLKREFDYQEKTYHTFERTFEGEINGTMTEWTASFPEFIESLPYVMYDDRDDIVKANKFEYYDLVGDYELPLLCGDMPSSKGGAVITQDFAEFLKAFYQLDDDLSLIGKRIRIGISTSGTISIDSSRYGKPHTSYMTIDGITTLSFDDGAYVALFSNGLMENSVMMGVLKDIDTYEADYVKLYIDPKADIDDVVDKINATIIPHDSRFIEFTYSLANDGISYDSSSALFIYVAIIDIILIGAYLIIKLATLKRAIKEAMILKDHGYNRLFISFVKTLFVTTLSIVIFVTSLYLLIPHINVLAIGDSDLMHFDVLEIIFVSMSGLLFMILINEALKE